MGDYIDVRGVWPIYYRGARFLRLVDWSRDITIETARAIFDASE
jgi:hypothetical protein